MIDDEKYMNRAILLARRGEGNVSPNPIVGAVIVHNGKIIGEGFHRKFGEGHAEVNAIASVKDESLLPESTIYVTLEPCSHYGKTPPCSKLIIDKKLKRVVVGSLDPFEKVRGRGVAMIKAAGIDVVTGVLEDKCKAINTKFITAHSLKRPFIILKWAETADGFIAGIEDGKPCQTMISNSVTSMLTHRQRALCDAIMVGSNTVNIDNPTLTVRNWNGSNPLRVVLDRNNIINKDSNLLNDGNETIIFTSKIPMEIYPNVQFVELNTDDSPLNFIMPYLYSIGITSILVEGGMRLLQEFIDASLWDEARIEKSHIEIKRGIAAPTIHKYTLQNVEFHLENSLLLMKRS